MRDTELLIPARNYDIAKVALYSGADAVYLATARFGARAYADNLSMEELSSIVKIASVLHKKIYVTVNTIIKDSELEEVYEYIKELYLLGLPGLIVADIAVYHHILENYPDMECHISTQVGVKDLYDVKYFEALGVKRVVIAREDSFEEIKYIRENTDIDLEIFVHGALCVSYSGGCLFSSMLTGRSGNRGRCAQNCRREYRMKENGKYITDKGYYLSMKDLNSNYNVLKLKEIGVDSLKIEGRMKDASYVSTIAKYYRNILDGVSQSDTPIEQIFHRKYTKGFLFGEDRGNITSPLSPSNEGRRIGDVIEITYDYVVIKTIDKINIGDRLKFKGNLDQYLTVKEIKELKNHCVQIPLDFKLKNKGEVYKMIDDELSKLEISSNLVPISIFVEGKKNEPLKVSFGYEGNMFTKTTKPLEEAKNKPTTKEMIINQMNKFGDTPFYLDTIEFDIEENFFISVKELNQLRRDLIDEIYQKALPKRKVEPIKPIEVDNVEIEHRIIAYCETKEQYEVLKECGIKTIFYQNVSPYVNAKYQPITDEEVLVSSYGGLYYYKNKEITTDYSFNVINRDAIARLLQQGVSHITLSSEASYEEIKELSTSFKAIYGFMPPLDMIIYGHQTLMTLKYCPLKALGKCGLCTKNTYSLCDDGGEFILDHNSHDCFTKVLNGIPLNLIDDMDDLGKYVSRLRLQFTTESKEEVMEVLKALEGGKRLEGPKTRGYFKRPIM